MACYSLMNGIQMPFVGIGTGGKRCDSATTESMLRNALDIGYRHIDTAAIYGTEDVIGKVIAEYILAGKLRRSDLFITTKISFAKHATSDVRPALLQSLQRLQTDYVDLYLIHSPATLKVDPNVFNSDTSDEWTTVSDIKNKGYMFDNEHDIVDTWKVFEHLYEEGLVKAIGVSNFNKEQLTDLCQRAHIKPVNLQIELHVHFPQSELREFCKANGISITAFAPIGCPGKKADPKFNWPSEGPIDDPIVVELAQQYNKTPAQILLRHLVLSNIIVVPKSTNVQRLRQNFEIFDFEILPEDMTKLNNISPRKRLYPMVLQKGHKNYAFNDDD